MSELAPIRVVVLGTGAMGEGIVRLVLSKSGLALVGVHARRAERVGRDVGEVLGLGEQLGLPVTGELGTLLASARPDVAIHATCSTIADAWPEIETLVGHGVAVVSIAEELAFPAARAPALAARLDALACERGVAVLGTGVNPGLVLDLLVIALSGACQRVESITATRVNDLSPYGPTVMRSQGVGLDPGEFERAVASGEVVGHIGFPESIAAIAAALGLAITRVEETRAPIVTTVPRRARFRRITPGQVAGCSHTAVGFDAHGRALVRLVHPQQIEPAAEGIVTRDELVIEGVPRIAFTGSPEIPGGVATIALAVNLIPHVLACRPGLRSAAEVPVPAALVGDARTALARLGGPRGG